MLWSYCRLNDLTAENTLDYFEVIVKLLQLKQTALFSRNSQILEILYIALSTSIAAVVIFSIYFYLKCTRTDTPIVAYISVSLHSYIVMESTMTCKTKVTMWLLIRQL